jgi:hypothetical protein
VAGHCGSVGHKSFTWKLPPDRCLELFGRIVEFRDIPEEREHVLSIEMRLGEVDPDFGTS